MIIKRLSLVIILTLSVMLILTSGCTSAVNQEDQLKNTTLQIQKAVQSELDNLDHDISDAASKLSDTGLSGSEARQVLNGVCSKYPFIIDCCTADASGKMVTVAPDAYSHFEGTDIGTQDVKEPALTRVFTAVEGMDAVSLWWPIFSEEGDYMGIISALFKPEMLLSMVIEPKIKETNIAVDVMQLDGLTIFDSEGADAGKNLLTDPSFQPYKELVEFGNKMAAQESGSGCYTFINHETGKPVKKQAFWASAGLYNTEWRLVSIQEVTE